MTPKTARIARWFATPLTSSVHAGRSLRTLRKLVSPREGVAERLLVIVMVAILTVVAPGIVKADYAAEVTADNPSSWWRFEDVSSTSGSAAADSAGLFDGTYNGDIELHDGVAGQSAWFDGNLDYIDIGAMGALPTQGAIEFWIRPDVVEDSRNPFTTGPTNDVNTGNHAIRFEEYGSGPFRLIIGDDSGTLADYTADLTLSLEAGTWVHVVTTWDTALGVVSAYLNGEIVVDNAANTSWPSQLSDVMIGVGYFLAAERCWQGNIDEVAIYDSRLSAGRVWAHHNAVTHGEQRIMAPTPWGWNSFGYSAGIDGETAIINSHGSDDLGSGSGAAMIYQWDDVTGAWVEIIKLTASDATAGDNFGYSVAISGDIAVASAIYNNQSATDGGAAYIFYRDQDGPDAWGEVAKLVASDAGLEDLFGLSVAIDGSTIVVGAANADGVGTDSGKAYVFEQNAGGTDNWGEVKILTASDAVGGAKFGYSTTISGDTVVTGAIFDPAGGTDRGAAYVFDRDQGGAGLWGEVTKLMASDAADGARFGFSTSIDGDLLVVGADRESGVASEAGAAYIFERNLGGPGAWGERTKLVPSEAATGDHAGNGVGVRGDFVVVGSGQHDVDPTRSFDTGAAYAFSRNSGGVDAWGEVMKFIASDQGQEDFFGQKCIAVGRGWVIVGANGWDAVGPTGIHAGAAYVFVLPLFADGFEMGTTDGWDSATP